MINILYFFFHSFYNIQWMNENLSSLACCTWSGSICTCPVACYNGPELCPYCAMLPSLVHYRIIITGKTTQTLNQIWRCCCSGVRVTSVHRDNLVSRTPEFSKPSLNTDLLGENTIRSCTIFLLPLWNHMMLYPTIASRVWADFQFAYKIAVNP